MRAASHSARLAQSLPAFVCRRCRRPFGTTAASLAGHNKWSKTKHIKVATDKRKMADRKAFIKIITTYSQLYGEDVKLNPKLATAINAATKANVPKSLVEAAIARGQGRSAAGVRLEGMTIEALVPPNIALIADVETDNKSRTLHDLRLVVKKKGGVVGSTSFYFSRRGRVMLKAKQGGPTLANVLEEALEVDGAEDVDELPDGGFVVWTQPASLMATVKALSEKLELEVMESDIVWLPNKDTMTRVDSQDLLKSLDALLSGLREYPEVKAVFANIKQGNVDDDEWNKVMRHIDVHV